MLRDLDLYHSIIKGYYIAADNTLKWIKNECVSQKSGTTEGLSARADQARQNIQNHLAEIWLKIIHLCLNRGESLYKEKQDCPCRDDLAGLVIFGYSLRGVNLHQVSHDILD